VVWVGAIVLVTEQFSLLMLARDSAFWLIATSITDPVLHIGERSFSLTQIAELPLLLGAVWIGVGLLTRVIEGRLARARGLGGAAQRSSGFVLRYVLTFVIGLVALQAWGIDVSSLALLASVLGVGVGFGLQGLVNNFVSGIVITVERPVRIGDYVRLGELTGTVERIGARSTQVRTADNVAIVVPNARLLESDVVNWTLGDPRSRLHVPVTVAYGSNLEVVRASLLEAARGHAALLDEPAPTVDMNGFGEGAIRLDLQVWTDSPRKQDDIVSDLNYRIERSFRRCGIDVPLPQHEIHIRSGVRQRREGETAFNGAAS
jgi:small-conductance mechanosensitive channel